MEYKLHLRALKCSLCEKLDLLKLSRNGSFLSHSPLFKMFAAFSTNQISKRFRSLYNESFFVSIKTLESNLCINGYYIYIDKLSSYWDH